MTKKKVIKFNKKILDVCPHCGKPKVKDERLVTEDRMGLIDENLFPYRTEGTILK